VSTVFAANQSNATGPTGPGAIGLLESARATDGMGKPDAGDGTAQRQRIRTEMEMEAGRKAAERHKAQRAGGPTKANGAALVGSPSSSGETADVGPAAALAAKQARAEDINPEMPPTEQLAPTACQANRSCDLPKFDHGTALEFYKAIRPDVLILGFTQGSNITSLEEFQALAKQADIKHEHLFFHVATVRSTWTSGTTATKEQILECSYLWGDCDATKYGGNDAVGAAKHYDSEGFRVRAAIDEGLGRLGILPCATWRSGAGWQFLIKLDRAISPSEAETLVGRLHVALGFEPVVRNCNRILRVPGSINWKHGKDGRVPSLCLPLSLADSVTKIDDVRQALANIAEPVKQANAASALKIDWSKVKQPGWLKSAADLPDDAPAKLKHIIAHTGNLKELNTDLIHLGLLTKGYGSWSDVTQAIAAIFKFCNHTPEQIAEVLLADLPCNQHVAKQKDKERAIERAITRSHDPATKSNVSTHWPGGQDSDTAKPRKGILNTIEAIKRIGVTCTYDEFRQKEYWTGHADKTFDGEVQDAAVTVMRRNICQKFHFYPGPADTRDAITDACHDSKSNPVLNYFAGLSWDGTPRLDKMLHKYLGAEDTLLNAAIGRKLMCAIVRRAKRPGCKYDHQVVLQSSQGVRKSTFCEDLAVFPDLFTDAGDLSADIKHQMEIGQGKQIIEFPEHSGFSRAARERNKAALSRKRDRARMAYAHYATDIPRQWVPIATINPGGYLNDPTGERRYWHVAVKKYDRDAFLADKDQIYAEAVVQEPNENLWLDTPALEQAHDAIVATAKEPNALVDDLADLDGEEWETGRDKIAGGWVIHREERVSNNTVRGKLCIMGTDALRIRDLGKRISEAMMALGWDKAHGTLVCKHGGKPEGGYRRPLSDEYAATPLSNTGASGAAGDTTSPTAQTGAARAPGGATGAPLAEPAEL
jgi:Virulence-associated protein E